MQTVPIGSPGELGTSLRLFREARHLTQQNLADTLDIPRKYIVDMERGEMNLYTQRLFHVLGVLGVQLRIEDVQA